MHFVLPVLATLAVVSSALPARSSPYSHVVHEKRSSIPAKWTKRSRMNPSSKLPVRVGLAQRNLDRAHEFMDAVSNPLSKDYGKHWTKEEVTNTFAPSEESRDAVLQWLSEYGIPSSAVRDGGASHTLDFDLSVADIENLLGTEYYVYDHDETGKAHVACEEYSVPEHIKSHINIITPTIHFDVRPSKHLRRPYGGAGLSPRDANSTDPLASCQEFVSPDCLRAFYDIPEASTSPCEENSFGVIEYYPENLIGSDLDLFFANFSPNALGARPVAKLEENGSTVTSDPGNFSLHGESNLDFDVAFALTYPQPITLYEIGLDSTETAADIDFVTTKVLSVSYGGTESLYPPAYAELLCNEYMKLGLQGTSVIYSSGDAGIADDNQQCPGGAFQPDFPASCPWVTAVGATQLDTSITDITGALANGDQIEVAIDSQVISGGGFSNYFSIPDYQQSVVSAYLTNNATKPAYDSSVFNSSGRAYPDIAANGHNYPVYVGGELEPVDGTSASAPTFASMIVLINEERLKAGKSSVGFLNPVLYQNADKIVKDVTVGNNGFYCNTTGFTAGEGWDPVTGLGTPIFPAMLDVFMNC